MKMKRVFKCNFCFDSKEIWDGIKKEYYPCNKCATEDRGNGFRDTIREGRIGPARRDQIPTPQYLRYVRPDNVGGGIYYKLPLAGTDRGTASFIFYRIRGTNSEYLFFGDCYLEISTASALFLGGIDNTVTPLITFSTVNTLPSNQLTGEAFPILRPGVTPLEEIRAFLNRVSAARLDIALSLKSGRLFVTTHDTSLFLGGFDPGQANPASAVYQFLLNDFIIEQEVNRAGADVPGLEPNIVHVEPQAIRLEDVTIEGDTDLDEDIFEDPTGVDDEELFF